MTAHPPSVTRVLSVHDEVDEASWVSCPVRHTHVDVEECLGCPSSVGIGLGKDGDVGAIVCRIAEAEHEDGVNEARVSDAMTTPAICVRKDMPIATLARLLEEEGIAGVPVVDDGGRALGVVSRTDLLRHYEKPGAETVADIMSPLVFSLPETASVAQAAALMSYEGVHRLPIVSVDGRVVGVLATLDVLRFVARRAGYVVPGK